MKMGDKIVNILIKVPNWWVYVIILTITVLIWGGILN
jgi:hypothetical protein